MTLSHDSSYCSGLALMAHTGRDNSRRKPLTSVARLLEFFAVQLCLDRLMRFVQSIRFSLSNLSKPHGEA